MGEVDGRFDADDRRALLTPHPPVVRAHTVSCVLVSCQDGRAVFDDHVDRARIAGFAPSSHVLSLCVPVRCPSDVAGGLPWSEFVARVGECSPEPHGGSGQCLGSVAQSGAARPRSRLD